MAGSSAITAKVLVRNDILFFSTGGILCTDTGAAYLDVSTMDGSKVILLVGKVGGKVGTIVVKDGGSTANPYLFSGAAQGDLEQLTTAGVGRYVIGPIETARFKDSDGFIKVFKDTKDTDVFTITAILLP